MSAGRSEDRLQRVERASSEIAIDDPERGERGRRCGLMSVARQRRVVCVNDVGCHRSWSLALLPGKLIRNNAHESDDQTSAMTATAISAVPPHPNPRSHDLALKRPIKFIFEIMTIITAIIGHCRVHPSIVAENRPA